MAEYRRKAQGIRGSAGALHRLLEFDRREAARPANAKRRAGQQIALDDYVLTQPAVCTGPKRPVDPSAPERPPAQGASDGPPISSRRPVEQFQFTPQRPASEIEFKGAYARVASALGLTREQAVRVLFIRDRRQTAHYDMQSGYRGPGTRPISTAIGYNQLLTTNSVELIAEQGDAILKALMDQGRVVVGRAAQDPGQQDCGLQEDDRVLSHGAGHLVGTRKACRHAAGLGAARHGARHRCRPASADPQTPDLG
jgi:hypothetical protein